MTCCIGLEAKVERGDGKNVKPITVNDKLKERSMKDDNKFKDIVAGDDIEHKMDERDR